MTQIQYVSEKEMTKQTGVRNALGYTFPKEKKILLKKGLKGKLREEVIEHEMNHLARGEEGPFGWTDAVAIGSSLLGSKDRSDANADALKFQKKSYKQGRADLAPYRTFGKTQLDDMTNWLSGGSGAFTRPDPSEISSLPGYDARLDAVENSAVGNIGLRSGNFLRRASDFGAGEYDREIARRGNELAQRLGLVNLGYGAAGGSAGLATNYGNNAAQIALAGGDSGPWSDIAGFAGQYQGREDFNNFLKSYRKS